MKLVTVLIPVEATSGRVELLAEFAEITLFLERGRNTGVVRASGVLARAFPVHKEEGLILLDRPAESGAILVAPQGRNLAPVEPVVGIQLFVAQELIHAAVVLIGSRAEHSVDVSVAGEA